MVRSIKASYASIVFISILLISYFFLPYSAYASVINDIGTSSEWHIRIDGAAASDRLSNFQLQLADIDGNGKDDLAVTAAGTDYNSRNASGSVYIIYDSILDNYTGTGNTIDLSDSSTYNLRIDGPVASSGLNNFHIANFNNDSLYDIVIDSSGADYNSRNNSGSLYVLYNSLLKVTGTGNTLDLASSSAYNLRIDGASASDAIGAYLSAGDIDSNNIDDMAMITYNKNGNVGAIYLIKDSILDDYSGTGNTMDLNTSTSYTVRYDGSGASYLGLSSPVIFADIDNDGKNDIIFGSNYYDYNSRTDSGSSWIVLNTLLDDYTGTGNVASVATSSTYNLRIDGPSTESYITTSKADDVTHDGKIDLALSEYGSTGPGYVLSNSLIAGYTSTGNTLDLASPSSYTVKIAGISNEYPGIEEMLDFTNDGYNDILFNSSSGANNGKSNSGSFYLIPGTTLSTYTSTGSSVSVNEIYTYRSDGASVDDYIPYRFASGDINGDGMRDSVFSTQESDYNSRSNSGSVWIVYNFPHTITSSSIDRNGTTVTVKGTVSASQSVTNISGMQYKIDNNTPSGNWTPCSADDGVFNSGSEAYTCIVGSIPLTSGDHRVYIRAYDQYTSHTSQAHYFTHMYNIGGGNSSDSSSSKPQISESAGGIARATGDSQTGGQKVLVIIEPHTFVFNAFLSSKDTSPAVLSPFNLNVAPALRPRTNALLAGGSVLGIKTPRGTSWQVGNLQQIWYKAYSPENKIENAAKILLKSAWIHHYFHLPPHP
jgi:hypothetical protein